MKLEDWPSVSHPMAPLRPPTILCATLLANSSCTIKTLLSPSATGVAISREYCSIDMSSWSVGVVEWLMQTSESGLRLHANVSNALGLARTAIEFRVGRGALARRPVVFKENGNGGLVVCIAPGTTDKS
jgi:hypothetical protein